MSIDLKALRSRVPAWWADAKLGIFIHWGLFAVPAYAPTDYDITRLQANGERHPFAFSPYAEWYQNSIRFPESPASAFQREHEDGRPYEAFVEPFLAGLEQWDPDDWADRFAAAGARYVVLVSKHHDGYCLWPTEVPHPTRPGWHTPRDVVGELADAVRRRGMRFGLYYSGGLDWTFDQTPIGTFADLLAAMPTGAYLDYAEAQVRELIDRYRPSVLWNDISWPTPQRRLMDLFGHYFEQVPDGVVNDRWLTPVKGMGVIRTKPVRRVVDLAAARAMRGGELVPPKPRFFQYRTPEFASFSHIERTPWECVRGMDKGFGYNRTSTEADYLTRDELLRSIVDIASKGGNLLLNVGPRGVDARIPDEQLTRLGWMAERAAANDRGLVGTRPWIRAEDRSAEGHEVRYTAWRDTVWAHCWLPDGAPAATTLTLPFTATPTTVVFDAAGAPLTFVSQPQGITIDLPAGLDTSVFTVGLTGAAAAPGATGSAS